MKLTTPEAYQLLHRGTLALAKVERAGVRIDMQYLDNTIAVIRDSISSIEKRMRQDKEVYRVWSREYGQRTNIGSRNQLAKILFKKMGFKPSAYTPASYDEEGKLKADARGKTDKDALDDIKLPFVKLFLKVENLKKTLGTYLMGLKREAVKKGRRYWFVHPIYNLNIASTYRSTCQDPNFQNVPKRDEEMSAFVRRCYLPFPGHHLVEVDFSTLEVRIAYCYNKDPALKKYLLDKNTDMHRDSAGELFMLPIQLLIDNAKEAKKTIRDSAKNQFVFPEFYGSVWFQCAPEIWKSMIRKGWKVPGSDMPLVKHLRKKGIRELGPCDPNEEPPDGTFARHVMEVEHILWKRFKVYNQWKRDFFEQYQRRGYFEAYTGFVWNTLHKRNDVINYPVQGSASHCKLWCLIKIVEWLEKYNMRSRVVGEVHDSIVSSVHPRELQDFLDYCRWVMTVALPRAWKWIIIPLEMEADVSPVDKSWSDTKGWVPNDDEGIWTQAA